MHRIPHQRTLITLTEQMSPLVDVHGVKPVTSACAPEWWWVADLWCDVTSLVHKEPGILLKPIFGIDRIIGHLLRRHGNFLHLLFGENIATNPLDWPACYIRIYWVVTYWQRMLFQSTYKCWLILPTVAWVGSRTHKSLKQQFLACNWVSCKPSLGTAIQEGQLTHKWRHIF